MEVSQRRQEIHLGLTLLLIYFSEKTNRKYYYDGRREYLCCVIFFKGTNKYIMISFDLHVFYIYISVQNKIKC